MNLTIRGNTFQLSGCIHDLADLQSTCESALRHGRDFAGLAQKLRDLTDAAFSDFVSSALSVVNQPPPVLTGPGGDYQRAWPAGYAEPQPARSASEGSYSPASTAELIGCRSGDAGADAAPI